MLSARGDMPTSNRVLIFKFLFGEFVGLLSDQKFQMLKSHSVKAGQLINTGS
jgi:hypothetical protein